MKTYTVEVTYRGLPICAVGGLAYRAARKIAACALRRMRRYGYRALIAQELDFRTPRGRRMESVR